MSRNGYIGVQAHAFMPNTTWRGRVFPIRAALPGFDRLDSITKTPPGSTCLGTSGDLRADGGGSECREQRVIPCRRIPVRFQASLLQHPKNSTSRARQHALDIFGLRRWKRMERSEIARRSGIDPVEYEGVEVGGEIQRRTEALYERDRPAMSVPYPIIPSRVSTLISKERTQERTENPGRQTCIPGAAIAERIRKCENPLTHTNFGQHAVDEMSCHLRHPSSTTRWTEPPSLT
jgi:hypothetical protein